MPPPPPPPLSGAVSGPPPPMPPQLQAMMRQMQQLQPKFQQQMRPPAPFQQQQQHQGGRRGFRGGRGGRGRGRGGRGGRVGGGFQQHNYRQNRGYNNNNQLQFKRKRGPSDDARDASRFFMASFLKDPWKELDIAGEQEKKNGKQEPYGREMQHADSQQQREEMRPRQVPQYVTDSGPGRVFFRPSFLQDPWAQLVR